MSTVVLYWRPHSFLYPGYIDCWHMWKEGSIMAVQVFSPITMLMNKKKVRLKEGEVVLISQKYKYIKFHNESSSYSQLRGFVVYNRDLQLNPYFCKILSCPDIKNTMSKLLDSNSLRPEMIDYLLNTYIPNQPDQPPTSDDAKKTIPLDNRLIKLNRYIRKNYTNPDLTLSRLSDLLNLNPTYISNCYSKVFKRSPIFHLNTIRINNAVRLLESNELKINEIAKKVGYSSAAQFSSIFRRYYHMSPSEYRSKAT